MRAKFRRMIMCHMIADTEEELHAMAQRIGVARRHYQGDHYDICLQMREMAVCFGAQQITWRQSSCMRLVRDWSGWLPPPDVACELWEFCRDVVMEIDEDIPF